MFGEGLKTITVFALKMRMNSEQIGQKLAYAGKFLRTM